jgi:hypothetical protein
MVADTGQSDIDPIQVMMSITKQILRLSITLNYNQPNEIMISYFFLVLRQVGITM